jgi:stage V sporulation protein AC
MDRNTYKRFADAHAPRSPLVRNCICAFLIGGLICAMGQGLKMIYLDVCGINPEDASTLTSISLVFLAALLSGLGIFDKVAKVAGAGTLVPITGFANAVVSPAIDCRAEGVILGVGTKIFTVAGPVLLYGILSGSIYGVLYWIFG